MAYKNKIIRNPLTGQAIRFLQTSLDTEGALLEMESSFAPHAKEPPLHYHPKQTEYFTVLEGTLCIRIAGKVRELKKGDRVTIKPKTAHAMWNASGTPAVVNWMVEPALNTEYFFETGMGLANAGKVKKNGMPSFLQTVLLARAYKNVFRLAKPSYFLQGLVFGVLSPVSKMAGYKAAYKEFID